MYPILFSIGRVNFYTHGLMIALGAILGGALIFYLAKRENLSRRFLFDTLVYSLFVGIVGARLVYIIAYYYQFSNWKEMFLIWYGGLVSFGGILFGFLTAGLILKKRHEPVLKWFDLGIIGMFIGWAIGRVGCFLSGDVPGVTSASKIAIWGQIPVSLFEAGWSLILAGILLYLLLWRKEFLSKFKSGFLFMVGIAGQGLGRFVIDFWRNEAVLGWGLKPGQIVSLVIFLGSALFLFAPYLGYKFPRKGAEDVRDDF